MHVSHCFQGDRIPVQDSIEVEGHTRDTAIVTLRGEHDISTKPAIGQALDAACLRTNVVVDLSECTFVDSSVVSELLRTARRLHQLDGLLALAVPSGARTVRRALEVMGVHPIVPVHETRAAAVGSLERAPIAPQERPGHGSALSLRATSEVVEESTARNDR